MIFNKYFTFNVSVFLIAFVCLLFSPFSIVFNFLSLFLFGIGTGMIAFTLTKNYKRLKKTIKNKEKEIMLEIATEDGGEQYVFKNSPFSNKQVKQIKSFFKDKLMTIIVTWFISLTLIYFSIKLLML